MKIKVEFYVSTRYVGSDVREEIELDVPENLTENELDDFIRPIYEDWAWEALDSGWQIIS